jgi:putative ABC transport system ATP-binding protein
VAENLRTARPDADRQEMERVLAQVALAGSWLTRDATALSGGEAQRMCLARTLITRPAVLLLDEPTSAMDATAQQVIEEAVTGSARAGLGVLWVTHDPDQLQRVADRVLRIERGRCAGVEPVTAQAPDGEVR